MKAQNVRKPRNKEYTVENNWQLETTPREQKKTGGPKFGKWTNIGPTRGQTPTMEEMEHSELKEDQKKNE